MIDPELAAELDAREDMRSQMEEDYIEAWIEGNIVDCSSALEQLLDENDGTIADMLRDYRDGDEAELASSAGKVCRILDRILRGEAE